MTLGATLIICFIGLAYLFFEIDEKLYARRTARRRSPRTNQRPAEAAGAEVLPLRRQPNPKDVA